MTASKSLRSFSLAEVVVSIAIVALMLPAAMHTVSITKTSQRVAGEEARGLLLAEQLMTEILAQSYADPDLGPDSFGLGGDEVTGNRSLFEDVDDYDGWSASPPQARDGTPIGGMAGWTRRVRVRWVSPLNLSQVVDSNSGVKRIEVSATYGGREVAVLTAIRTGAADNGRAPGGVIITLVDLLPL